MFVGKCKRLFIFGYQLPLTGECLWLLMIKLTGEYRRGSDGIWCHFVVY